MLDPVMICASRACSETGAALPPADADRSVMAFASGSSTVMRLVWGR